MFVTLVEEGLTTADAKVAVLQKHCVMDAMYTKLLKLLFTVILVIQACAHVASEAELKYGIV